MINMTEQEYRTYDALNQSKLKLLLDADPSKFEREEESRMFFEEKEHFVIGNAVDCLITSPGEFDNRFYISKIVSKPSDVIKSIINQVYFEVRENEPELLDKIQHPDYLVFSKECYKVYIDRAITSHDYYSNLKHHTRIAKIIECYPYWEEVVLSEGKTIISSEEKSIIDSIEMSLLTNEAIKPFLRSTDSNVGIYYQHPIIFTYQDILCKGLIDVIRIDHNLKEITIIDVKTSYMKTLNFGFTAKKRRYDIQMAFYHLGIQQDSYIKGLIEEGYTLNLPIFIVESTSTPGQPLIYEVSQELLDVGINGSQASYCKETGRELIPEIKGINSLLEDLKYYQEYGFEVHRDIRQADRFFVLNGDFRIM